MEIVSHSLTHTRLVCACINTSTRYMFANTHVHRKHNNLQFANDASISRRHKCTTTALQTQTNITHTHTYLHYNHHLRLSHSIALLAYLLTNHRSSNRTTACLHPLLPLISYHCNTYSPTHPPLLQLR